MQKNKKSDHGSSTQLFLFCVSLLFLKLFFFCHDGNGPGRAQLETGRAGLGLIFLERQRAGPAGPGRKKRARAGLPATTRAVPVL